MVAQWRTTHIWCVTALPSEFDWWACSSGEIDMRGSGRGVTDRAGETTCRSPAR